jgi:hypothetical protein
MASDEQFTALGPTIIGFQTHGTNIDKGASITGNQVGVEAHGNNGNGVHATSDRAVGVFAQVSRFEMPAIIGKAGGQNGIGVLGHATHLVGDGVMGIGELGHGGFFQSRRYGLAQVRLFPHARRLPGTVPISPEEYAPDRMRQLLPSTGHKGDLLHIGGSGNSAVWLCVDDNDGREAEWQQLLLGSPVRGEATVDLSQPIDEPGRGTKPTDPEP